MCIHAILCPVIGLQHVAQLDDEDDDLPAEAVLYRSCSWSPTVKHGKVVQTFATLFGALGPSIVDIV